jgi:hypothetical protein
VRSKSAWRKTQMVRAVKFDNYEEDKAKKVLQFMGVTYGKSVLDTLQEIQVTFKDNPDMTFIFVGSIPEMLSQATAVQHDLVKLK